MFRFYRRSNGLGSVKKPLNPRNWGGTKGLLGS